ncbi:RNA polymerase sporulation sigma factor SigH [Streptohalobacillus salinus]|nr:RNA polymerase sporulation sigma factor SigH [Streptohalobacillus salinus]
MDNEQITYEQLSDERLTAYVKAGDPLALEYLIQKYRGFVRKKAGTYFLVGADYEDIVQEGMVGLYKAVRDFDDSYQASFRAFAELCVTRQMITAIKAATRLKHSPLNSYVSLDKPMYDEESERTLLDVLGDQQYVIDPEAQLISQEQKGIFHGKLDKALTSLEREVLYLYLEGLTYQEISTTLNRHVKSIDNALQRIKRKLERDFDWSLLKI